jgi:hypothetical protein
MRGFDSHPRLQEIPSKTDVDRFGNVMPPEPSYWVQSSQPKSESIGKLGECSNEVKT